MVIAVDVETVDAEVDPEVDAGNTKEDVVDPGLGWGIAGDGGSRSRF